MSETALKFGPEWLRALSGSSSVSSPPLSPEPPKYKLAEYRYGREEMLALFPKDPKMPDSLKEFHHLVKEKFQLPLALMPTTDEEQRIWATSVNSEVTRVVSGKGGSGPGVSIARTGRGGSVDRGRGRGRGSYYPRGISFEDGDDGPPGGFPRPRPPMERSQSANEKDQRWDDRDRRFDRPYNTGRNFDDSNSIAKQEGSRASADNWRKSDKMDDDGSWRTTAGVRGEKHGTRGSWRNHVDKDRNHEEFDKCLQRNHDPIPNGPSKNSHHKNQRHSNSSSFWDEDTSGKLPEWSMDEPSDTDIVGTFDSSGAFLETKIKEDSIDEIYASEEEEDRNLEDSPEIKHQDRRKSPIKRTKTSEMELPETVGKPWAQPSPEASEEPPDSHLRNETAKKVLTPDKSDKVTNSVIISNIPQQTSVTQPSDAVMLNVPDKNGLKDETNSKHIMQAPPQMIEVPGHTEEDTFAHHKKATENMVAQWTEEEEHRIRAQSVDKTTILPPHHEDAYKWFYRDPQGEIQGPFASTEMLEWFQSGYFTMGLMVRRGCDEVFSQLGHLIKAWGQVPFLPMVPAPPIRATVMTTSPPTPMTQTTVPTPQPLPEPSHQEKSEDQLRVIQQQLFQQQLMQQQLLIRQAQLQQLLTQLKTQDNFTNLNPQQQYEVLIRQFCAQQPLSRPGLGPMGDQASLLEQMPTLALPLLGIPMPSLMKNDLSLWGLTPPAGGPWPVGVTNPQPPSGSIWDTDQPVLSSEAKLLEEQKRIAEEERKKLEELRKLEEEKKREEERRKREEMERKQEEERLRQEFLKKEEERRILEELKRQQEEQRRQEELKRIEEQKRKEEEERQLEEQRRQEELRQQEEKRRQAELEEKQRQEALRKKEEKRRLEEQKKLEEQKRQEELRKLAEQKRLEEQKRIEERKKMEEAAKQEELQRQKKLQKEKEQQRLEQEKQKELLRQKELEAKELKLQQERERQQRELLEKQREMEKIQKPPEQKLRLQGPVWGARNSTTQDSELSLDDIQRLQEEKEKEEREERLRQQMFQQLAKQGPHCKNGPSWAKRPEVVGPTVLSLAEIQQEEANKLAQQQKTQKPKPVVTAASPLTTVNPWGNSSHIINKVSAASTWNYSDVATTGFWDDFVNNSSVRKSSRNNDSAFPALNNVVKPANASSNKSKNAKTKKDEENVIKLFESHRKATDEFTQWCTDALSSLPSSLDVPTFVAFLKDIESPYEVYDYVRSYLGESKEAREFGKQFLEKRSRYRNQAKQIPAEENMWGPAPAITPSVNKSVAQPTNESDGHMSSKGKTKKKKNKMQKVDNSILGFTVQSNPDRINVGEIDHVDGM